jgi:hypothetical protein
LRLLGYGDNVGICMQLQTEEDIIGALVDKI